MVIVEVLGVLSVGLFLSRWKVHSHMYWISSAVAVGIHASCVFNILQCIFPMFREVTGSMWLAFLDALTLQRLQWSSC